MKKLQKSRLQIKTLKCQLDQKDEQINILQKDIEL